MYNEEIKRTFIKEYTTSIKTAKLCEYLFDIFEKYELGWGADLCTKEAKDLQPIIDNLMGLRTRSKWSRVNILRSYAEWCIRSKVPGACNGIFNVNIESLEQFKYRTVANPLQLKIYLDTIFTPEKDETIDNLYRCYHWLAYGGVKEEDILKIKCKDVDLSNMIVRYRNTEIPIYREAIASFRNCLNLTRFATVRTAHTTYRDRLSGDTLIRGCVPLDILKIRNMISRKPRLMAQRGESQIRLSYYRLWISGLFYREYEREKAGLKVNFDDAIEQYMEDKTFVWNGKDVSKNKKREFQSEYMEDYQRWKLAFRLM